MRPRLSYDATDRMFKIKDGSATFRYSPVGAIIATASTTDATVTDCTDVNANDGLIPLADGERCRVVVSVAGHQDDDTDYIFGEIEGFFYRNGGNVSQYGSTQKSLTESNASTDVNFALDTSAQAVEVQVTGIASENWSWTVHIYRFDF